MRSPPVNLDPLPSLAAEREKREPNAGTTPVSLWLIAFCAVTLFVAAFYAGRYSGSFAGDSLDPVATGQVTATSPPRPKEPPPKTDRESSGIITVMIRNMKYNPPAVEVKKGAMVEWRNEDITPHTATSGSFDSGSIESDKAWRHTFTENGNFPYACTFHPEMTGTVNVKE